MAGNTRIDQLRRQLISKTRAEVREHYKGKDVHVIKAVNILEDLDSVFNLLSEQLLEWYAVYFPELTKQVKDPETILNLIYHIGKREDFTKEKILENYNNPEKAEKIATSVQRSIGADVEEQDVAEMKLLALNLMNLKEERQYLAKYIEKVMSSSYPNFTKLAGPILGAKLISRANSFKKLAFVPSSTIQILGAEKALFKSMKAGTKGPKYGFLYQHPLVREVRAFNKGKVARSLAAKLSIAAREDYFGKQDISDLLQSQLESRVQSISSKKPSKKLKRKKKK